MIYVVVLLSDTSYYIQVVFIHLGVLEPAFIGTERKPCKDDWAKLYIQQLPYYLLAHTDAISYTANEDSSGKEASGMRRISLHWRFKQLENEFPSSHPSQLIYDPACL